MAAIILAQIRSELNLTASAGVAPNKFLAKIASDWRKPNGLFVIQPHEVVEFLRTLPIGRVPGVGKVTEKRLMSAGIKTIGDVQDVELAELEEQFGRYGQRLYELARGTDHSPVVPNRVSKSISAEDTFPRDLPLPELQPAIHRLADKVWNASRANARQARTIVLKLKTREFTTLTRSVTPTQMPTNATELAELAISLFDRIDLGSSQLFRLAGVGLSNFQIETQLPLLASSLATESTLEKFTPTVE